MKIPIYLLLLVFATAVSAQEAKERTCRILFLDAPEGAPEKLQLFDGAGCREVDLPRMNLSKVYSLPAGPLNLRLLPAPPEDPAKIPADAPAVAVAEGVTDFYLLVTSDPANTVAPVRMQVIDAGAEKLGPGRMLWLNLSKNPVEGMVGSEKLLVEPDARVALNPPASDNEDYLVNLNFRIPGKESLYPLCETKWHHDSRARSLVFIITENGQRIPRVMVFPDYREPKVEQN
jgi:hypothetical protein